MRYALVIRHRIQSQRGDTIVEVLVCLAVLGLALGVSFATANRSLQMARNAQEHSEALQYLNSQVEMVRAAASNNDLYNPALYGAAHPFCMTMPAPDAPGDPTPPPQPVSVAAGGSCTINERYELSITYDPAPVATASGPINQDIFTFTVSWDGIGTLGPQKEQLRYKIHNTTLGMAPLLPIRTQERGRA